MYKVVFSDIDGTLAFKGTVTCENISSIKRYVSLNNCFILVSGRSVCYTVNMAKKVGASNYVIANNGAIIYDCNKDKIIYKELISFDNFKAIEKICGNTASSMFVGGVKENYVNILKKHDGTEKLTHCFDKDFYNDHPVTQVVILNKNREVIESIINKVKRINGVSVANKSRSLHDETTKADDTFWIDIVTTGVSKGKAVKYLLNYLGTELSQSVRVGDDLNDLSMFLSEGLNVATKNGVLELKNKADYVTESCLNSGVAEILDKIMDDNNMFRSLPSKK